MAKYNRAFYLYFLVIFHLFLLQHLINASTGLNKDSTFSVENQIIICKPYVIDDNSNYFSPQSIKITNNTGFEISTINSKSIKLKPEVPNSDFYSKVVPYLIKSKEIKDIIKLRIKARQIRYQIWNAYFENITKKNISKLQFITENFKWSDFIYNGVVHPNQADECRRFFLQQITTPLVILSKSPAPLVIVEGPAMIPMGASVFDPVTNKQIVLDTSSVCIVDMQGSKEFTFSWQDAITNDTLDIVLCHEIAHCIMYDMYGREFANIKRISINGHNSPLITDKYLAFKEGWAEAFEAIYGVNNLRFKEKDREKHKISEFLFTRQDPVRREKYIWARHFGKKTGLLKNGSQMMATEGVIAGLFYDILTSKAITASFEKCITTMMLYTPKNFEEFIKKFLELYPEDKKVILRIVLENTRYAIMDNKARHLYFSYYQNKLLYTQKKISNEEFTKAKNAYIAYKEELYRKALNGANIFGNVGPEIWLKGKRLIHQDHKTGEKQYRIFLIDLNTATPSMLKAIGLDESSIEELIMARNEKGFFSGNAMQILKENVNPNLLEKIIMTTSLTPIETCEISNIFQPNYDKYIWPEMLDYQ